MKLVKTPILLFAISLFGINLIGQPFTPIDDPDNPINTINLRGFYRGCAWVDVDNDGDLDLSMQGWALRNDGNGDFSIINSFGSGPTGGLADFLGGVSWADYDNDGDLDCLYSHSNFDGTAFGGGTIIYENDGTGTFTEKQIDTEVSLRTWSASFGDFNNDAFLDVTGAVAFNFSQLSTPAFFYLGNADGSFTKLDTSEFTQNTAPYTVAYWLDYDQDGDSDLFIASGPGGGPGPDYHYRNTSETGRIQLKRITDEPFANESQDGQCYNLVDHDLDGDLDLYLTNYGGAPNRFYENQNGTFVSVTNNLVFPGSMLGNCWGDFDNDGDEDVLLTSDAVNQAGYFENEAGVFTKVSNPFMPLFTGANVSGLTIGDYDNEGDLDFCANGGVTGASGPRALFQNDLDNENHWVQFDLVGELPSNRSAIGASVWLQANIDGQVVWLHRSVSAQNTFMGHNSLRLHFGLGSNPEIDTVRIHWPSGNINIQTDITADAVHQITEGEIIIAANKELIEQDDQGVLQLVPNPAKGICHIRLPEDKRHLSGKITISDITGKLHFVVEAESREAEVDVSNWAAGVYSVVWETTKGNYIGQLIVK